MGSKGFSFSVQAKKFVVSGGIEKRTIQVQEDARKGSYSIGMEQEQALWLLNTIPEVLKVGKKGVFKCMHRSSLGCVLVETFNNARGSVMQIAKIPFFLPLISLKVRNGNSIRFCEDPWVRNQPLKGRFPPIICTQ